ncbi:hypothetical protein [Bradyrhizobium elkanii]|uniref:hypothetical protein n=1 Tax=Bradyrhizobium elkanii TaxID=29448 RepID=UPI0004084019|nr:hypothetical protein [Bradyrhizobium elkanii]
MMIAKEDLHAALTCLAERSPQTFVLERYHPHQPLVMTAADPPAAGIDQFKALRREDSSIKNPDNSIRSRGGVVICVAIR